jgi:hypothetical protein
MFKYVAYSKRKDTKIMGYKISGYGLLVLMGG